MVSRSKTGRPTQPGKSSGAHNNDDPSNPGTTDSLASSTKQRADGPGGNWGKIPRLAIQDKHLTAAQRLVLIYYMDWCWADRSRSCYEGIEVIARNLRLGKDTVSKARAKLVDEGYINIRHEYLPYPAARNMWHVTVNDVWDANDARFVQDLLVESLTDDNGSEIHREDMSLKQLAQLYAANERLRSVVKPD